MERLGEDSRGRRFVVVIRVDPARLDLFFNSSSGYRAQLLAGPQIGRRADRHVSMSRYVSSHRSWLAATPLIRRLRSRPRLHTREPRSGFTKGKGCGSRGATIAC
ncbi:MAG: hypothetical protein U1F17_15750 [Burkholderiaceae bacterium]